MGEGKIFAVLIQPSRPAAAFSYPGQEALVAGRGFLYDGTNPAGKGER
jgi:hypothetical protein